jgi:putative redox protein
MTEQLEANLALTNDKVQFSGTTRDNPAVTCDYFPPIGDGEGYTGLELLLMSLATCSASTIVVLLRKMRKTVTGFTVHATGIRQEQPPTAFEKIQLDFTLQSTDAEEADMQKAIELAENTVCPVWAMLKNNVEVAVTFKIVAA